MSTLVHDASARVTRLRTDKSIVVIDHKGVLFTIAIVRLVMQVSHSGNEDVVQLWMPLYRCAGL